MRLQTDMAVHIKQISAKTYRTKILIQKIQYELPNQSDIEVYDYVTKFIEIDCDFLQYYTIRR